MRAIKAGSINQYALVSIRDQYGAAKTDVLSSTSGLAIKYQVDNGTVQSLTPASMTVGGAHVVGGIVHSGNGCYAVGLPGSLFSTANNQPIRVWVELSGCECIDAFLVCVGYDPVLSAIGANTTTPPTAAAVATAVWGAATRTITAASDSSGITMLLSRITGLIRTKTQDDAADTSLADAIAAIDHSGGGIVADAAEVAGLVADRLSGQVVVSWPVVTNGKIRTPVVRGDDYLAANNRQFRWTVPAPIGTTAIAATCRFGAKHESALDQFVIEGTITEDIDHWHLDFDVVKDLTEELVLGWYSWSVEVRDAQANEMTQLYGKFQLIQKFT